MTFLYEAVTVEDIYLAYETLKVDDDSLFACVGIAGNRVEDAAGNFLFPNGIEIYILPYLIITCYLHLLVSADEEETEMDQFGPIPAGRGLSTMTRPTT